MSERALTREKEKKRESFKELRGDTAHKSSLPAGRLAELSGLPFVWPWHTALKQSAPTSDPVITDLLRGPWRLATMLMKPPVSHCQGMQKSP